MKHCQFFVFVFLGDAIKASEIKMKTLRLKNYE